MSSGRGGPRGGGIGGDRGRGGPRGGPRGRGIGRGRGRGIYKGREKAAASPSTYEDLNEFDTEDRYESLFAAQPPAASQGDDGLLQRYASQIAILRRQFGAHSLDSAVLASVLEMVDGDVNQATQFLEIPEESAGQYMDAREHRDIEQDYIRHIRRQDGRYDAIYESRGESSIATQQEAEQAVPVHMQIVKIFTSPPGQSTFLEHHNNIKDHKLVYIKILRNLILRGYEFIASTKSKIIAALLAVHEYPTFLELMDHELGRFGIADLVSALGILDSRRERYAVSKKIARLRAQNTARPYKYASLQKKIERIIAEFGEVTCSITSSIVKTIRKWTKSIPPEKLEFFIISFPAEPWRKLANLCHLRGDDFTLSWFLSVQYGEAPPQDSMVTLVRKLQENPSVENWTNALETAKIPISIVRKSFPLSTLSNAIKERIARYTPLDLVVWYWEELRCDGVDAAIAERLSSGEIVRFKYGKLMERLLSMMLGSAPFLNYFIPLAEAKLKDAIDSRTVSLTPPIVVLGDASYSMDVAIRVSTIIGSLLAAMSQAEIRFFGSTHFTLEQPPRTIQQVLQSAVSVRADGMTNPCCALKHYYNSKIKVGWFIVISDEMENTMEDGEYFPQVFDRYYKEVHPARIAFISFLESTRPVGRMCQGLELLGHKPLKFRLHAGQPDLTKLDSIILLLSARSEGFEESICSILEQ